VQVELEEDSLHLHAWAPVCMQCNAVMSWSPVLGLVLGLSLDLLAISVCG